MNRYCLDADILIQAKNGPYGFDIVPAFWSWLDQKISDGTIFIPKMVYSELVNGSDKLADWIRNRKNARFVIEANIEVQTAFKSIADHVEQSYLPHHVQAFLGGADPWVIAHAKEAKAVVVTGEVLAHGAKKIKIPNICKEFDIPCIDTYQMLRNLKATFK